MSGTKSTRRTYAGERKLRETIARRISRLAEIARLARLLDA